MNNKTDYEVEGCWSNKQITVHCRLCGKVCEPVPRQGHYNSEYWKLERNDGQILVCCPNDCSVESAEKKMKEYLQIRNYCTTDSQSWKYKLDYNKVFNAWINRQGRVYPIGLREHTIFAYERNTTERDLENKGWLKLTYREFFWSKQLSKRQIDIIFDYIMIIGTEKDIKKFKECIDNENFFIKIGANI